jgi:hypothetical protein
MSSPEHELAASNCRSAMRIEMFGEHAGKLAKLADKSSYTAERFRTWQI